MMQTITEKAKEIIEAMFPLNDEKAGVINGICQKSVEMALTDPELLKAQNLSSNEWINTKDEIPKSNEHVLCITNDFFNRIVEQSWSKGCDQNEDWFKKGFTHWQKLPIKPTK